ncbi:MAG: hypothetical protein HOO99_13180 [Hyphomicrobiaceae bacterium]|nr:hypothetical protein [Hyphomicrobiaceae bacterium]
MTENRVPGFGPWIVGNPTPQISLTRLVLAELSGLHMMSDWRASAKPDPHRTLDDAENYLQDLDDAIANTAHNSFGGALNEVANQTKKSGDIWEALQTRAATIAARIHETEKRREVRNKIHTNLMAFMRPADIEAQLIAFVRALTDPGDPAHTWIHPEELNQSRSYFKFMSSPLPDQVLALISSTEHRLPQSALDTIRELGTASSKK